MLKKYSLSVLLLVSGNSALYSMPFGQEVPPLADLVAEKVINILCDQQLEDATKIVKTLSEPIKNCIKHKLIENHKIALYKCFPFLIYKQVLEGHMDSMCRPVFGYNGKFFITGSRDGTLYLWNSSDHSSITCAPLKKCKDKVASLVLDSQSTQALTGSLDGSVRLWDLATWKPRTLLENGSAGIDFLALSSDNTYAVAGSNDFFNDSPQMSLLLWNLHTDKLISLSRGGEYIETVAFSPDGKHLAVAEGKMLCVWDINTLKENILEGHASSIASIAWSPDSEWIVTANQKENAARLWNRSTLEGKLLEGHSAPITSIGFSPRSNHILTGSHDKAVRLWDTATAQSRILKEYKGPINGFRWAPDGRYVVIMAEVDTIELMDIKTLQHIQLREYTKNWLEAITSLAFNGTSIVGESCDGKVHFWYLGVFNELSLEQLLILLKLEQGSITLATESARELLRSLDDKLRRT
jgi:WD40 repeat protein